MNDNNQQRETMDKTDELLAQCQSYNPELQWENVRGGAFRPIYAACVGEDLLWRVEHLDPGVEVFRQRGDYTQTLECLVSDVPKAMRAMDRAEEALNAKEVRG